MPSAMKVLCDRSSLRNIKQALLSTALKLGQELGNKVVVVLDVGNNDVDDGPGDLHGLLRVQNKALEYLESAVSTRVVRAIRRP